MPFKVENIQNLRQRKNEFCRTATVSQLAVRLGVPLAQIEQMCQNPIYNEFDIPKKSGKLRHIEDPTEDLKGVLRNLNYYLQATYFFYRTEAAFGFMTVPDDDKSPRTIKTNAECHINQPWLLNADFLDFFHQIKMLEVFEIFLSPPFSFSEEIAEILYKLTTYKGRLPMGSPTSPVLSNFSTRLLDTDLLNLAAKNNWVYTRFADDLSFSSKEAITIEHLGQIRSITNLYGLRFNENKIHFFMPHQTKTVTGLVVTNRVDIPQDYINQLKKEIDKLSTVLEINYRTGRESSAWLERYKHQITGAIEFVRQIETSQSPDYQSIKKYYADAQLNVDNFEAVSWLEFGYHNLL